MTRTADSIQSKSTDSISPRLLYFVVPIRHPDTVKDKEHQQQCLSQLFNSMSNQSSSNWKTIVVANYRQGFPKLPSNVEVRYVDIGAGLHESKSQSKEEMFVKIRTDKGTRIAAAMSIIPDSSQVMIVDDDDLLHQDLVRYVTSYSAEKFWYVDGGYFWENATSRVGKMSGFYKLCGSSLILPKTAYAMFTQKELGMEYAINELGSHKLIFDRFKIESGVWQPVPFRAAIYRVQHTNASLTKFASESRIPISQGTLLSRIQGLARGIRRGLRGDPRGGIGLYPITRRLKSQFFGK